jgi:hypothetical protein
MGLPIPTPTPTLVSVFLGSEPIDQLDFDQGKRGLFFPVKHKSG